MAGRGKCPDGQGGSRWRGVVIREPESVHVALFSDPEQQVSGYGFRRRWFSTTEIGSADRSYCTVLTAGYHGPGENRQRSAGRSLHLGVVFFSSGIGLGITCSPTSVGNHSATRTQQTADGAHRKIRSRSSRQERDSVAASLSADGGHFFRFGRTTRETSASGRKLIDTPQNSSANCQLRSYTPVRSITDRMESLNYFRGKTRTLSAVLCFRGDG
ncbi:hypothetical protein QBC47DRAFT_118592 [Echria macrotheca]|uniref:Uncharacterized protein n=1 Tax=Echria macrotheca TaxID=438768 RepID=A0AAJ0F6V4_9PEZI|nr:hypothetical protein QBC47DRAFT_118592 [Echria macrotheca]